MSTKFPSEEAQLPLTVLLQSAERRVTDLLIARLSQEFPGISAPHVMIFGALDCGATYAAQVAARLFISRQAVARTARELVAMGFVRLVEDPVRRNQNQLVMTQNGERLALAGRAILADIEKEHAAQIGPEQARALREGLTALWSATAGAGPASLS